MKSTIVKYAYNGQGFWHGVPARDLAPEEFERIKEAHPEVARAMLDSGIYAPVKLKQPAQENKLAQAPSEVK